MRKPLHILGILTLLSLIFALLPTPVWACSCAMPEPPAQALERATAVFAGQVTRISGGPNFSGLQPYQVELAVDTVWKGQIDQHTVVHTAADSAACGFGFEAGQSYLVYTYASENGLETNLCTRTQPLASAGEDLEALGEGQAAQAPAVPTPDVSGFNLSAYSSLILCMAGLILIPLVVAIIFTKRMTTPIES